MLTRALLLIALLLAPLCAQAQPSPQNSQTQTFYAFTKIGRGTDISATTVSSRQALTAAPVAMVFNSGTNIGYVALGNSAAVAVATTGVPVPPGSCVALNATGATHIAGITASSTTTLQIVTGTGVFGSCPGGGGTVTGSVTSNQGTPNTGANAWPVTQGTYTPTAPTTSGATVLVTGATAQTLFTAGEVVHDCVIINPATATERVWVNFFTTAVQGTDASSVPIEIGQSIGCGGGLTTAVSWIAATINHRIFALKK